MKLSAEQTKTFLRIQRKHNVSVDFLLRNMPAILKFVQYAITPHIVLKLKLIRKRNRVFLRYNYLRKLIFDPSKLKQKQRLKYLHSQWSKRLVMYLRRYKVVEFFEDEMAAEGKLPEEDVSKQLKEQLELLKSGKRTVPLLEDVEQKESAMSTRLSSVDESKPEEDAIQINETDLEEPSNQRQSPLRTAVDSIDGVSKSSTSESCQASDELKRTKRLSNGSDRPNGNFLDMLISKVKSTTDDISETCMPPERSMEPPKQPAKSSSGVIVEIDERENSNSSSDFFGFDDNERIPGTFPGMLSTPLVEKRDFNSAFESETLNAFMRDNSLESSAIMDFPQRLPEDGLVHAKSIPPKLDMPALPDGLQGLRTVAERRTFLQKTRNVKYCIMNNVGTVFRELQKRMKGHRINRHAIEAVQASSTIPLTRQGWKTATWLLTDEGNYYFQTIAVDGKNFRLFGCRGNSQTKFKRPHTSKCGKISPGCTEDCMDRIIFRALRPIRTIERRSKLSDAGMKVVYKACPLSQKILQRSEDDEPIFDKLEIVRMPQVELEVFPQLQTPLNDIAKRYLQLILPYDGISREWAEFSVSTLVDSQKIELDSNSRKSFTFPLPYANDRDHVLVRRVYNRSEAFEGQFDNSTLSFRKEIDQKKTDGEPPDLLAEECADVLTDMLNSVAISCSENSFLKDDPDNIYQYGNSDDEMMVKSVKKTVELPQHHGTGHHKKQSRLLMELRRLNATIIDAAVSKSEEDGSTCDKESCKLGCVCASLNEGNTVRQHCGKQRCILECNCRCPSIMRLETDGRTITTEDAFMLRRQATAKLARMEKEFTSTIVLTGSETLLINESQYDKKRRCTKIPKRYGDFVDPDESDLNENKPGKRIDTPSALNFPLEPIMVKDTIYQCLRHCTVNVKRLRDFKDVAPWCMVHQVYKCYCKGQSTVGNPIVLEKQEEHTGGTTIDEAAATKNRTLYSFDKEETRLTEETSYSYDSEYTDSDDDSKSISSLSPTRKRNHSKQKKGSRMPDHELIEAYMNSKANHCRRVVPIPKKTYIRRNKKRVARVQLYIAENETNETGMILNEHVLRSVYYHKNNQNVNKRSSVPLKQNEGTETEQKKPQDKDKNRKRSDISTPTLSDGGKTSANVVAPLKRRRMTYVDLEEGTSLLRVNRYKDSQNNESPSTYVRDSSPSTLSSSSNHTPLPQEQITVPKISQIFSLNTQAVEMGTDTAAAVAADIPQQSTEAAESAEGVSSEAFKNVFQVVIKNMNNLVSKKMQDIDMALRRESKAIPAPNDEILCIIRWNNFLEAFTDGFVFLWEVRTVNMTFIAATIRNVMPLVVNALSVVNIRALPKGGLPLLGRMLVDRIKNGITDGLAVVMQGQKMYWFVKGFLRPDKTRICPKPTPETHPLLTKKINILCRLLINQQINEHKKRQETTPIVSPSIQSPSQLQVLQQQLDTSTPRIIYNNIPPKLKVLPMQRNISDHATTILEQMVTQAYGLVRSNVTFRKLRQSEIKEIYQPASMNSDHHWLVLDLSNDFSHIFIPELRDLLTLDRIQKVMAYAVSKSRIVKMQFSLKSIFNAYVTPMSRRKLYFGPFRNTIHTPKLVLLQSVDGQMMLREVYESRHNVTMKTDKTTAFWLIQKQGKLFLDVEAEVPIPIAQEESIEIQDDDDDVSVVPNAATGPQSDNVLEYCNVRFVLKDATSVEKTNQPDDDDDCMIVEDDSPAPSAPPSSAPNLASPERFNYTISYAGDNSSLIVIQNECERTPGAAQGTINNNFTILTSEVESPSVNSTEAEKSQLNSSQHLRPSLQPNTTIVSAKPQDPEAINIPTNIILKTTTDSFQPISIAPDIILSVPTNTPKHAASTSSPTNSPEASLPSSTEPVVTEPNISEPSASAHENDQKDGNQSIEKGISDPDPNLSKLAAASMKWNKNVTITKVLVENEQQNKSPAPVAASTPQKILPVIARKPITVTSTNTGKIIIPNQLVRFTARPGFNAPIRQAVMKPAFQMPANLRALVQQGKILPPVSTGQPIRQIHPQSHRSPNQPFTQRPTTPNLRPQLVNSRSFSTTPRPMASPQGMLTVRTPTAINTLIKSHHQQQLIRHPLNTSSGNVSLLRPTNPSSSKRPPVNAVYKNMSRAVFVKSSPNSSATVVKSQSPLQQHQFKRTLPESLNEFPIRSKIQKLLSLENEASSRSSDSPQSDPLHISEDSPNSSTSLQPKLPNEVKTVRITPNETQTKLSLKALLFNTSSDASASGVKKNSTGTVVSSPTARLQQNPGTSKNNPATVVTTVNNSITAQNSQVKGIPIELPRLKKFAIMSSTNTTVITPPTSQSVEPTEEEEGSSLITQPSENPSKPMLKRKIITSGLIKSSATLNASTSPGNITKSIIKVPVYPSSDASSTSTPNPSTSTNSETEYGYFHANIEGLPKFVVKRVGDDYLIKVPNFNGILKLTSLSTVHNYLNQYTTQKCGKTAEDIVNLKWTFRAQDRSKLNNINKTNSSLMKGASDSPTVQQVLTTKRTVPAPASTSPAKVLNCTKPTVTNAKKTDAKDSIVLLDDE